jgi:ABC-type antimicrobial peptide transport system permease subunit
MSSYVVRTVGDPGDAFPVVRDVVKSIDPALALTRVETLDERFSRAVAPRQFNVWLVGLFALVALVLAAVGIYGLISEAVANRTAEIGVRMALGAGRLQVMRLVAGRTVLISCVGLAAGMAATTVLTRWLGSMIFGVEPLDPPTLAAVPLVFAAVGAIAALVPVRRATRIDPVKALRGE